jgi:hypothetical protein
LVFADARISDGSANVWDDFPKLIKVGERMLCGIVGLSTLAPVRNGVPRLEHLIPAVIQGLCGNGGFDRPRDFVSALVDGVCAPLAASVASDPSAYEKYPAHRKILFGAMCVRRGAEGDTDLYEVALPFSVENGTPTAGAPVVITHAEHEYPDGPKGARLRFWIGWGGEIAKAPFAVNPDDSDAALMRYVDDIVAREERKSGQVGGAPCIAVIESAGVRVLRKYGQPHDVVAV